MDRSDKFHIRGGSQPGMSMVIAVVMDEMRVTKFDFS